MLTVSGQGYDFRQETEPAQFVGRVQPLKNQDETKIAKRLLGI
jgi:hypothetical protein